jgi:hypothetical protein
MFAGYSGANLGNSIVNGGGKLSTVDAVSGTMQPGKFTKKHPDLVEEFWSAVERKLDEVFGSLPWYRRLKDIARRINEEEGAERCIRGLPLSAAWLSIDPSDPKPHCDTDTVGAVFSFTTSTEAGAPLLMLNKNGNMKSIRLERGKIMAGTWAQYAHNVGSLRGEGDTSGRMTWILYLDKRAISRKYKFG